MPPILSGKIPCLVCSRDGQSHLPPNRDLPLHLITIGRDSEIQRVAQKAAEITGDPKMEEMFKNECIGLVRMQTVYTPYTLPHLQVQSTVGFVTSYVRQEMLAKMSTEDLSFVLKGVGMNKAGHRYDSLPRCSSSR